MTSDEPDDVYPLEHMSSSAKFEVQRVSLQIDAHYAVDSVSDVQTSVPRARSRIAALTNQLTKSQNNFESTSARFNELASVIPGDIADLSDRLAGILRGAMAEAEDIRAEAHRFAEETRDAAERDAAMLRDEAREELETAADLRAELETQHRQLQVHAARLRQQAVLSAAEIMEEAESQAVEILAQMNHNINTQVAEAQLQLNALMDARAKIIEQINRSTARVIRGSDPSATNLPERESISSRNGSLP